MEVQLYVYDLSQGLARTFSRQFLGTQIDAVYHTSTVLDGVEYFFGRGIQTSYPGATHHGQPMEVISLGKTEIPMEVILEYLESLSQTYTAESYDLFLHNCNNFSHDFAMFLVGKGIPEHITSLPQRVLNTPFGQMLRPMLDSAMRGITQAPVAPPPASRPSQSEALRQTNGHIPNGASNKQQSQSDFPELLRLRKAFMYPTAPDTKQLTTRFGRLVDEPPIKAALEFTAAHDSSSSSPQDHPVPDLPKLTSLFSSQAKCSDADSLWSLVTLTRLLLRDTRVAGYFAERADATSATRALMNRVEDMNNGAPAELRLAILQMSCNLFNTTLAHQLLATEFIDNLVQLCTESLLQQSNANPPTSPDAEASMTLSSARLVFNIASTSALNNHTNTDKFSQTGSFELTAAVLQALTRETEDFDAVVGLGTSTAQNQKVLETLARALGMLLYAGRDEPGAEELRDLCGVYALKEVLARVERLERMGPLAKDMRKLLEA